MQSFLWTSITGVLRPRSHYLAALTKVADFQSNKMINKRNMSGGGETKRPFHELQGIDNLVIKKGAKLPFRTKIQGVGEIRIEHITQENGTPAWELLKSSINLGLGYSADELEPLDVFLHNAETERNYFQIVDHIKEKIISICFLKRCPISRSEKTVHFSSLVTASPDYRGKGFGHQYTSLIILDLGRAVLGHPGFIVGRAAIDRGMQSIQHAGFNIIGTIPNCSYLEGAGWMPDVLFASLGKHVISDSLSKIPEPELPPLVVSDVVPASLQSDKPPLTNFPPLAVNGGSLYVELASPQDVWKVEEMIRQAAQKGEGFGLDEFNAQGHFNRALLFDSHVVTVKTNDDTIVAAAIFGPTKMCRAYNPEQAGGYIIVNEEYRNKGVGNAFTKYLIKQAQEAGYKGIVTDVFCLNIPGQEIMNNNDFTVTGSMPHCGYVKGQGYIDSTVYHLKMSD